MAEALQACTFKETLVFRELVGSPNIAPRFAQHEVDEGPGGGTAVAAASLEQGDIARVERRDQRDRADAGLLPRDRLRKDGRKRAMAYNLDDGGVRIGFDNDPWSNPNAAEIEVNRYSRREGRSQQCQGFFCQSRGVHGDS